MKLLNDVIFAKLFGTIINAFSINIPLLHLLKTSENPRFSDIFWGYRSETLVKNGLLTGADAYLRPCQVSLIKLYRYLTRSVLYTSFEMFLKKAF